MYLPVATQCMHALRKGYVKQQILSVVSYQLQSAHSVAQLALGWVCAALKNSMFRDARFSHCVKTLRRVIYNNYYVNVYRLKMELSSAPPPLPLEPAPLIIF